LADDFANLTVELAIVVKRAEPIWVPIRLDGQSLAGAREGAPRPEVRRADKAQWQVRVEGEGAHRIRVDLRAPVGADSDRKSLAIAIPEAQSTVVALDYS